MTADGADYDRENPMRFSLRHNDVNIDDFGVHVTDIEIRPSEGNIYVHWRDCNVDTGGDSQ